MSKKKSNKNKLNFKSYLGVFLVIVSLIVAFLVYFIGILPTEYFIVMAVLMATTDLVIILFLRSKKTFSNIVGLLLAIILIIIMIFVIIYELNTIDFFKQFGNSAYKTETYNVVVLSGSDYEELKDLDKKNIAHLDEEKSIGLKEAIGKIKKQITFTSKRVADSEELVTTLIKEDSDAIIIDEATLTIMMEEEAELVSMIKIIANIDVDIKVDTTLANVDITKDSFNIFISGIDTYGSITKVARSDVNILATINPKTNEILLTNIPRDYYVLLHSYKANDKLTHAGIYGIEESVNTIEDLLDTNINYYVKVNFTSVIEIVDALGGITINSNYDFTSQDGYHYNLGTNTLNGEQALSFARERKAFDGGDRVRGENQQIILTALINKALSPSIITNYISLLNALEDKFVTNLTDKEITDFIKEQISSMDKWSISSISLTGSDAYDYTYSYKKAKLYVMKPDEKSIDNAKLKINEVLSN